MIFLFCGIKSRSVSRRLADSSPKIIRPLQSTTRIPSTVRVLSFICTRVLLATESFSKRPPAYLVDPAFARTQVKRIRGAGEKTCGKYFPGNISVLVDTLNLEALSLANKRRNYNGILASYSRPRTQTHWHRQIGLGRRIYSRGAQRRIFHSAGPFPAESLCYQRPNALLLDDQSLPRLRIRLQILLR